MPPPKTKAQMTREHNQELRDIRRQLNEKTIDEGRARSELERARADIVELKASLKKITEQSEQAARDLVEEHKRVAFLQGYIARFLDDEPPAPITLEKQQIIDRVFETMASGSGPGLRDFPRRNY